MISGPVSPGQCRVVSSAASMVSVDTAVLFVFVFVFQYYDHHVSVCRRCPGSSSVSARSGRPSFPSSGFWVMETILLFSFLTAVSLLVLGGPGSGKGSQCEILAYKRNFKHISGGDLLRHEASVFIIGVDFYKSYS